MPAPPSRATPQRKNTLLVHLAQGSKFEFTIRGVGLFIVFCLFVDALAN